MTASTIKNRAATARMPATSPKTTPWATFVTGTVVLSRTVSTTDSIRSTTPTVQSLSATGAGEWSVIDGSLVIPLSRPTSDRGAPTRTQLTDSSLMRVWKAGPRLVSQSSTHWPRRPPRVKVADPLMAARVSVAAPQADTAWPEATAVDEV
jgi:hypothetical protein